MHNKLIEAEYKVDVDDPRITFYNEGRIAKEVALLLHWSQVLATDNLVLSFATPMAKKLFSNIIREALTTRVQQANAIEFQRNAEIVGYMDKIDELKSEIHKLEQRLKQKNAKQQASAVQSNVSRTSDERHTPIPDHASTSHA